MPTPTKCLFLDLETYSGEDIAKSGAYRYAASPDFKVLLFAYAWDDGPVQIVDLTRETLPDDLRRVFASLTDPAVLKHAHNANFERTCLTRFLGKPMPPEQWDCTMVRAARHGLPLSLEGAAFALNLEVQKDPAGRALIHRFCTPQGAKETERYPNRCLGFPDGEDEQWESFKRYCMRDVEVERALHRALSVGLPEPSDEERALWALDQRINDRGVRVDLRLVRNAVACDAPHKERTLAEMRELTGLENPNSPAKLKAWLAERGLPARTLRRADAEALARSAADPVVRRVMALRLEAAKTSIKKYEAMEHSADAAGVVRGLLQFYGAKTGRWTGRLVQVQNLPRNDMQTLDDARQMLLDGDFEGLELFYRSVPDTLSQLIRTALVPTPGRRFLVGDFSAIEARVISWLAGERWRLKVFAGDGKIYEASAAQMFGVPVESVTKGSPLRQRGKIAELALGYQGSHKALIDQGALDKGLREEELPEIVSKWRAANPNIVSLWKETESAAVRAVESGRGQGVRGLVRFAVRGDFLLCRLPSGRSLCYPYPRLDEESGQKKLSVREAHGWERTRTYGGKLVENVVQAIARDCLAAAMLAVARAGMEIAFHVHDEIVVDAPLGRWSAEELAEVMGRPIPWALGLPLRADAYEARYYQKD